MVKIYTHDGITKRHIGTCENGKVYREEAIGETEIGSYENGDVYSGTGWTKKRVGGYDSKTIYKSGFFDDAIGEVDASGDAYDGTDLFKNITGRKIRDVGAAAAAQLLFPGCYYEEEGAADVSTASSASSDSGDESSVLTLLFGLLGGLLLMIWRALPFLLPYCLNSVVLFGMIGPFPLLMIIYGIVSAPYIPFMVVLLVLKLVLKKDIPGRYVRRTCWLWCLIGAFSILYLVKKCRASGEGAA